MAKTILLVEDDPFHRAGVKLYLGHKGFEIIEAEDKRTAQALAAKQKPDVAVIDISIPVDPHTPCKWEESMGIELALWLKELYPTLGIVLLSAHPDRGKYFFEMIDQGIRAIAYQVKGHPIEDLLEAINGVQFGRVIMDPEVTGMSTLVKAFQDHLGKHKEDNWVKQAASYIADLTVREMDVAQLIAASYTTKGVAATLNLTSKAVGTHTTRIYDKLGLAELDDDLRKSTILAKAFMLYEFQQGLTESLTS